VPGEPPPVDLAHLPRVVDISTVQAFHSRRDVVDLAETAAAGGFVSAHVLPSWVPLARELLQGSGVLVGSPVGFPSGGSTTATKVFEARGLLEAGVQELDVVVNLGRLRSGEGRWVTDELAEVVELVAGRVPLRAILEVGHLSEAEVRLGCDCVVEAGVGWVKTATGWSGVPTTVEHVRVVADQVAGRAQVKAAGGIRDLSVVRAMVALGVTRFGMNAATAAQLAREAAEAEAPEAPEAARG